MSPTLSTTKSHTGVVNLMVGHLELGANERVEYPLSASPGVRKKGSIMGKELPILPSVQGDAPEEAFIYSRVFCSRENSPPLRLLLDFVKSKGQIPLIPKMDPEALDDWAWIQISIGYNRERKPIQLVCARDRGSYQDVHQQERDAFLERLSIFDDIEAQLARECVRKSRFLVTTRMVQGDVTDEGYDMNGWILEFFQEQCDGIVQIDGQGFFSPKGELIVDMEE